MKTESNNYIFLLVKGTHKKILLCGDRIFIGRSSNCHLPLNSSMEYKKISRYHISIFCKDGKWYLEDMHSKNGTYLNGEELLENKPYRLQENDIISLAFMENIIFLNGYCNNDS